MSTNANTPGQACDAITTRFQFRVLRRDVAAAPRYESDADRPRNVLSFPAPDPFARTNLPAHCWLTRRSDRGQCTAAAFRHNLPTRMAEYFMQLGRLVSLLSSTTDGASHAATVLNSSCLNWTNAQTIGRDDRLLL